MKPARMKILHSISSRIAASLAILSLCIASETLGQSTKDGFSSYSGRYCEIVTDLALGDELRELTSIFDAAIPLWCEIFDLPLGEVRSWRATAHIMGARERFISSGKLPKDFPKFPHGFQWKNDIWVVEQPSDYYRRHLLLHEGTHWFMARKYGSAGPPWLMEGVAEWLATHRWNNGALTLGVIPRSRSDVPYWGRIALIQDQLSSGVAPSLESILRYGTAAHQNVDAYAWSWAAVTFMRTNPDTQQIFQDFLATELKPDQSLNRRLFNRLQQRWPHLRTQWAAFVSELDYGYDTSQSAIVQFSLSAESLARAHSLQISARQSWQATGVTVSEGQKFRVTAQGRFVVRDYPKPWICEPPGVTIEYFRGQPLGKLLVSIMAPSPKESDVTEPTKVIPVGASSEIRAARSGELFFKINETNGGLVDNSGDIHVELAPMN